jgi:1-aminocyclopropane-1-carboxylate deaminase/D-cysteine desulfhydrase-like pyridoxal-dependent ACC family enzyme
VNSIEIDPVYQVKMLMGLRDLAKKDYFSKEDRVLIMHTGGTQATKGYDFLAKMKGKS